MNWTWHYNAIQGRLQNVQGSQITLGFCNFTLQLMTSLITTIRMIMLMLHHLVMAIFSYYGHKQKLCMCPFVAIFFHLNISHIYFKDIILKILYYSTFLTDHKQNFIVRICCLYQPYLHHQHHNDNFLPPSFIVRPTI